MKNSRNIINTFSFVTTLSYSLTSKISVTTGLGKGFMDDGNSSKSFLFTNGDFSTGIAIGYTLPDVPNIQRELIGLSASYEYNIT